MLDSTIRWLTKTEKIGETCTEVHHVDAIDGRVFILVVAWIVSGVCHFMAISGTDFPLGEFGENPQRVIESTKPWEMGDSHLIGDLTSEVLAPRAGEAGKVISAREVWSRVNAVSLNEISPGFAALKATQHVESDKGEIIKSIALPSNVAAFQNVDKGIEKRSLEE